MANNWQEDRLEALKAYLAKRVISDEIVVKAQAGKGIREISTLARSLGGQVTASIERRGLYLLKLPRTTDGKAAIASLRAQTGLVQGAFENILFHTPDKFQAPRPVKGSQGPGGLPPPAKPLPDRPRMGDGPSTQHVTNDPWLGYQWHLAKTRELLTGVGLGTGAPIIAVLDTGVASSHPDLYSWPPKVLTDWGYNFVAWNRNAEDYYDGHGTHVAGIAAAVAGNAEGVHGVCPDCPILPVKVLSDDGWGTWYSIMAGIDYADWAIDQIAGQAGAKGILNMSLGGMADPNDLAYIEMASLLAAVAANNKVIVVAAGNDTDYGYVYCQNNPQDQDCGGYLTYIPAAPATSLNSGLSVAASNPNDYPAWFSNTRTAYTNVVAPGRFIWSTTIEDWCTSYWSTYYSTCYAPWEGTSMAAPIAAGAVGRVWTRWPTQTAAWVKNQVATGANPMPTSKGWPAGLTRLQIAWAVGDGKPQFVGYVVNPESGSWQDHAGPRQPIDRVTVNVQDGSTVVATARTNKSGFFVVDGLISGKTYNLQYVKPGYQTRFQAVTAAADVPPLFMPVVRTAVAPYEEILVVLEWDSVEPFTAECIVGLQDCTDPANKGAELDLYLKRPDGTIVSYFNLGDDYGRHTRDSIDDMMPGEALYIKDLMTTGADPHYTIAVNRSGAGFLSWGRMTTVNARVRVWRNGAHQQTWNVPAACGNVNSDEWWTVATINKTNGNLTTVGACSDTYPL